MDDGSAKQSEHKAQFLQLPFTVHHFRRSDCAPGNFHAFSFHYTVSSFFLSRYQHSTSWIWCEWNFPDFCLQENYGTLLLLVMVFYFSLRTFHTLLLHPLGEAAH
jgi:hypothetical protein